MRADPRTSSRAYARPWSLRDTRSKTSIALSRSMPVSSSATPFMYTACAPPTGTDESKIAIATSGRAARYRECFASGDETQWKLRQSSDANHTGVTHGCPFSSTVPSAMYLLASITLWATSASSGATGGLPRPTNLVAGNGATEAVELQFAHRCGLDGFLDRRVGARPDEYLAGRGGEQSLAVLARDQVCDLR